MSDPFTRRGFLFALGGVTATGAVGNGAIPRARRGRPGSVKAVTGTTPPPETQWTETYGPEFMHGRAHSVVEASDGGYLFVGEKFLSGGDAWLVKVDTGGTIQWEQTYSDEYRQKARSVIGTSGGGYLFAGWMKSGYDAETNAWVVKVDAEGTGRWEQTYGGGENGANSVIETSDGGYLVAGYETSSGDDEPDAWLVKVDTNGTTQWRRTYGGGEDDWASSVIETSDGGYLLASGTKSIGNGEGDAWLVKVDAEGTAQWEQAFGGSAIDTANSVTETGDRGYLFAGTTASSGNAKTDAWVVKVDAGGTAKWERTYGGGEDDWASSVIETSDGGYLLAGATTSNEGGKEDAWLVKAGEPSERTTPSGETPTGSDATGTDGAGDAGENGGIAPSTRTLAGNGNGPSEILLPSLGAGSVGWLIGFITGNTENKNIKREFLNILLVGFGGVGVFGLLRWFLEPGGDEAALLVAVLTLGLFAGVLVGIYLRKRDITISTSQ